MAQYRGVNTNIDDAANASDIGHPRIRTLHLGLSPGHQLSYEKSADHLTGEGDCPPIMSVPSLTGRNWSGCYQAFIFRASR